MAQRSMMLIEDICRDYGIGISLYLVQDDPMQMSLSERTLFTISIRECGINSEDDH